LLDDVLAIAMQAGAVHAATREAFASQAALSRADHIRIDSGAIAVA
jgi:hypothetical protein